MSMAAKTPNSVLSIPRNGSRTTMKITTDEITIETTQISTKPSLIDDPLLASIPEDGETNTPSQNATGVDDADTKNDSNLETLYGGVALGGAPMSVDGSSYYGAMSIDGSSYYNAMSIDGSSSYGRTRKDGSGPMSLVGSSYYNAMSIDGSSSYGRTRKHGRRPMSLDGSSYYNGGDHQPQLSNPALLELQRAKELTEEIWACGQEVTESFSRCVVKHSSHLTQDLLINPDVKRLLSELAKNTTSMGLDHEMTLAAKAAFVRKLEHSYTSCCEWAIELHTDALDRLERQGRKYEAALMAQHIITLLLYNLIGREEEVELMSERAARLLEDHICFPTACAPILFRDYDTQASEGLGLHVQVLLVQEARGDVPAARRTLEHLNKLFSRGFRDGYNCFFVGYRSLSSLERSEMIKVVWLDEEHDRYTFKMRTGC